MSLEYCYKCDNVIDLDYEDDHEHFMTNEELNDREHGEVGNN